MRKQTETHRSYEEKWQQFKPTLDRFLQAYSKIRTVESDWRREDFAGVSRLMNSSTAQCRPYALWLSYGSMFKEKVEFLGRHMPEILGNLDEYLDSIARLTREGDRILRGWNPPRISLGISFRLPHCLRRLLLASKRCSQRRNETPGSFSKGTMAEKQETFPPKQPIEPKWNQSHSRVEFL